MLNILNFTLKLNNSRDYLFVCVFIYLVALWALILSDFSCTIIIILQIFIVFPIISIIRHKKPHPKIEEFAFHQTDWRLNYSNGSFIQFDTMEILLEVGFFSMLRLTDKKTTKLLIIFHDQITHTDLRRLRVAYTVGRKKVRAKPK